VVVLIVTVVFDLFIVVVVCRLDQFTILELVECKVGDGFITVNDSCVALFDKFVAVTLLNFHDVVSLFVIVMLIVIVMIVIVMIVSVMLVDWLVMNLMVGVVLLFFFLMLLFVKFVVSGLVDGITVHFFGWKRVEGVWGEEITEIVVSVLLLNFLVGVLELGKEWQVLWQFIINWSGTVWLW